MRRCTSKQIVSWCCLHCFAQIQLLVSRQLWSTITRRGCSRRRHAFAQSKPSPIAGVTEWPQTRTDGDVNPTCGGGRDGAALLARDKPSVSVSRRSLLLAEEEPKQDDDTPGWSCIAVGIIIGTTTTALTPGVGAPIPILPLVHSYRRSTGAWRLNYRYECWSHFASKTKIVKKSR